MLSFVKDGKLVKVEGDPACSYSQGKLCAKGYAYVNYVYSENRLKYPLMQIPRGSGNWQRISWEQALTIIAEKMIDIKEKWGTKALGYNKFSGNLGVLHFAVEALFNSIGPHTKPIGNLCLSAGQDAQYYDFGGAYNPDPEDMQWAKGIIIWGANPAVTATQQFHHINRARAKGAQLVVIDPVFTATAAQADLFIQIKPGTDGLLALAVVKELYNRNKIDMAYVQSKLDGWHSFENYLKEVLSLEDASKTLGIPSAAIGELADLIAQAKPCTNWIGFGFQRHVNGGQNVRAVNTLSAVTGNMGLKGGGVYYSHGFPASILPSNLENWNKAVDSKCRHVSMINFAQESLQLTDPPLKFLWIACRNPITQDPESKSWDNLLNQLDFTVTVDLFMTATAQKSDMVLPAASFFEEYDINYSYWHYWIGLNQQAISPLHEAKSDLQITRELVEKINSIAPGMSNFPSHITATGWIEREFNEQVCSNLGIKNWHQLLAGPVKLKPKHGQEEQYSLYSPAAKKAGLPAMPKVIPHSPVCENFPFKLLTPQLLTQIHSQGEHTKWLNANQCNDSLKINPVVAHEKNIRDGDLVEVYNGRNSIIFKAQITSAVPKDVVIAPQASSQGNINTLIAAKKADMGSQENQVKGVAYYDTNVNIRKVVL